jgi:hypothetical protein
MQCVIEGRGPQTDKHLPPNPFTGKFLRKDDIYRYSIEHALARHRIQRRGSRFSATAICIVLHTTAATPHLFSIRLIKTYYFICFSILAAKMFVLEVTKVQRMNQM